MKYYIVNAEEAYTRGVARHGHRTDGTHIIVSEKEASLFGLETSTPYSTAEIKKRITKGNWK